MSTRTPHLVGRHADGDVWIETQVANGRLSISGVVGPRRNGNAAGSCGQIQDVLTEPIVPAKGWTPELIARLHAVWERWHLNDMVAGSPRQMEYLRTTRREFPGYPASHYEWAKSLLADAGLEPDAEHDGYSYGSAWLTEELPADVIEFVTTLPVPTKEFPWAD